jgi:hypothetical protein
VLTYPKAVEREKALNLQWSGKDKAAFAWTTVQDEWDNRRGLLVPAPGRAAWDLEVPPAGELHFTSGLVAPEIKVGPPSDGATVRVEVDVAPRVRDGLEAPSVRARAELPLVRSFRGVHDHVEGLAPGRQRGLHQVVVVGGDDERRPAAGRALAEERRYGREELVDGGCRELHHARTAVR